MYLFIYKLNLPRQYNYSRELSMKRSGAPLRDPHPLHKKSFTPRTDEGELTYNLKMLQNWQVSPQAIRYLEMDNKVKENRVIDFTCPQLCLMVYSPNIYQQIIDGIIDMKEEERYVERMDVESVQVFEG